MKPLSFIYWSRAGLGIGTALLTVLLNILSPGFTIYTNISVALLVYIIAYYIYKWRFFALVEKPSKIATQGIGAYFLTWIVALGLFVTILHPTAAFTYTPQYPITDNTVTFDGTSSHSFTGYIISYEWNFGDENITTTTSPLIPHVYTVLGNYTVTLRVTNNFGFSSTVTEVVEVKAS